MQSLEESKNKYSRVDEESPKINKFKIILIAGISLVVIAIVSIPLIVYFNTKNKSNKSSLENETDFNILFPEDNKVYAAGDIDFKFQIVNVNNKTVKYSPIKIYIDDQQIGTTSELIYHYYTTKVKMLKLSAVTQLDDGRSVGKTIKFGITKKGIGANEEMGRHLNLSSFGAGWYFNWYNKPSSGQQYSGIEFVPMLWGEHSATEAENKMNELIKEGYKYVFLFNEPDRPDQCNMPVNEVYQIYKSAFQNKNIQMSAPMTSIWPSDSDWFKEWASVAIDVKTDFIVLHVYPDNFGGEAMANWLANTVVDGAWNTYHKKIWINEFSTIGSIITEQSTIEFYRAIIPLLDSREYVVRYSPFDFNGQPWTLWDYATGQMTNVGKVFAELGNPQ